MITTLYWYEVLVARRHLKRGLVLALNVDEATQELLARFKPAIVLSLRVVPKWLSGFLRQTPLVGATLSEKDLAPIMRQLALLLKAGVPVDECMANLVSDAAEAKNERAGHVLRRMSADLQGGLQISAAMAKQPDSFPEMVRCLAVVGDQTGLIDESLMEAADHLEKSLKLKSNFKQALIYPIFTFGAMFGAAAFWIIYVVPNMAALFKQMNVKLPP
ncbi:type II secretion system F family protein [Ideonella paludis]